MSKEEFATFAEKYMDTIYRVAYSWNLEDNDILSGDIIMHREPVFTPIDLQTRKRGQIFYYFSMMTPTDGGYYSNCYSEIIENRICV